MCVILGVILSIENTLPRHLLRWLIMKNRTCHNAWRVVPVEVRQAIDPSFRGLVWSEPVELYLGGGFRYFLFSPLPGEMIQFDEHIFQMGWFNHQLVIFYPTGTHVWVLIQTGWVT